MERGTPVEGKLGERALGRVPQVTPGSLGFMMRCLEDPRNESMNETMEGWIRRWMNTCVYGWMD